MASDNVVNSNRKRTRLSAKQVPELLMDSDEATIGNDDYDSSELETEDDDVSRNKHPICHRHFQVPIPTVRCL